MTTPLDALHRELGARMVPFAGYEMPVQYPAGIIREHEHTREQAGLFDVSHMGQVVIEGPGTAALLERLVPADVQGLAANGQTYALLTNEEGGVRDDLIITRWSEERFFLVVNAACKAEDLAYLEASLAGQKLTVLDDRALLALQGPAARAVLSALAPDLARMPFLRGRETEIEGATCYVTCSGYTGEDGFELSVPAASAEAVARRLLAAPSVAPAGLGARDSLRLEAGLCLYGHELDAETNVVDAGLYWSVGKARRPGGEREGGFPGANAVFHRKAEGPAQRRVGLRVEGRRPVRDGQPLFANSGEEVGVITSACYGPSAGGPIAMGYVAAAYSDNATPLEAEARGKRLPVTVAPMPFIPQRYYRG
ncbi:Aminomethyltransferase (glycine cleavage system T protein) [Pseudohaliea rubra DSM 19751]|uniref:aminomethyltransferase n=1 Tax=Pseudohaliea rubra DSM 19751 TaxID=1265313 RepID=A0A095XYL6_9GAMM|nr:Aminomethyltransferase (glycine cleavage system T protein) [Pseudohaliea rubra DSM 19751]